MFLSLWLQVTSPASMHTAGPWHLAQGQHLQLGTLTLPAGATIEGTIVDDEGKPRCGIQVSLFRHDNGLDLWVYTDRFGRYACSGLPAGEYSVQVDSPHSMHVEWLEYARVTVRAGERVVVTRGMAVQLLLSLAAGTLLLLVAGWIALRRWRRAVASRGG